MFGHGNSAGYSEYRSIPIDAPLLLIFRYGPTNSSIDSSTVSKSGIHTLFPTRRRLYLSLRNRNLFVLENHSRGASKRKAGRKRLLTGASPSCTRTRTRTWTQISFSPIPLPSPSRLNPLRNTQLSVGAGSVDIRPHLSPVQFKFPLWASISFPTAHCTLHTAHFTLHTAHGTLHTA